MARRHRRNWGAGCRPRAAAAEARGETFYPGASRVHLAAFPPKERWDDWVELSSRAWPAREEQHYMLVPTTCFNCESACGLLAYVDRDTGQVRKFEGNPEHPGSRGRNCAKGPATINQVTDPDRILYPLRRSGPRGERRLGADQLGRGPGRAGRPDQGRAARRPAERDHGAHRAARRGRVHRARGGQLGGGRAQLAHQRVLERRPDRVPVLDGHRPAQPRPRQRGGDLPDQRAPGIRALLQPARAADHPGAGQNGAKVIVLDTRLSNTATHADYWLAPQPGSEAAINLAIASHLIRPAVRPAVRAALVELGRVPDRLPPGGAGHFRGIRGDPFRAVRGLHVRVRRRRVGRFRGNARRGRGRGGGGGAPVLVPLVAFGGGGESGRLAGVAHPVPHLRAAGRGRDTRGHVPERLEQVRAAARPRSPAPWRVAGTVLAAGVSPGAERDVVPAAALPQGRARPARHLLHPRLQPGVDQPRRPVLDGGAA